MSANSSLEQSFVCPRAHVRACKCMCTLDISMSMVYISSIWLIYRWSLWTNKGREEDCLEKNMEKNKSLGKLVSQMFSCVKKMLTFPCLPLLLPCCFCIDYVLLWFWGVYCVCLIASVCICVSDLCVCVCSYASICMYMCTINIMFEMSINWSSLCNNILSILSSSFYASSY